ncbi:MAG: hypothetical protein ACOVVK_02280 [Elsteraceae bacterium]
MTEKAVFAMKMDAQRRADFMATERQSMRAHGGVSNEEVEALFAQRRAEAAARPEGRLLLGSVLQEIGRKHDITHADMAAIEQAQTKSSAEPLRLANSLKTHSDPFFIFLRDSNDRRLRCRTV